MTIGVSELPMAIHLTVTESAFELVALCPAVCSLPVDYISAELAHVLATVRKDRHALTVLFIAQPGTLVLGHNAILISLSGEELKPVAMSHHFKLFDTLLLWQWLDLRLVDRSSRFDHLII